MCDIKKEEYSSLRNEIIQKQRNCIKLLTILISAFTIGGTSGFIFEQGYIFILLPILNILVYRHIADNHNSILIIAKYISEEYEGWEQKVEKIREKYESLGISAPKIDLYITRFCISLSSIFAIVIASQKNSIIERNILIIVSIIVFTSAIFYLKYYYRRKISILQQACAVINGENIIIDKKDTIINKKDIIIALFFIISMVILLINEKLRGFTIIVDIVLLSIFLIVTFIFHSKEKKEKKRKERKKSFHYVFLIITYIFICFVIIMSINSFNKGLSIVTNEKTVENRDCETEDKISWNFKNYKANNNGNLDIALKQMLPLATMKETAKYLDETLTIKNLGNYYGEIIKINGTIKINETIKNEESYEEMVLIDENDVKIKIFNINKEQNNKEQNNKEQNNKEQNNKDVSFYGYPIGFLESKIDDNIVNISNYIGYVDEYSDEEENKVLWNTRNDDSDNNGNLEIALGQMSSLDSMKKKAIDLKEPLTTNNFEKNYYGKIIKIKGKIKSLDDYNDSDEVKKKIILEDETNISFKVLIIENNNINEDDEVLFYGYPIGFSNINTSSELNNVTLIGHIEAS